MPDLTYKASRIGLHIISRHATAPGVQAIESMLRPAVTLLGGLQIPFEGRFIVAGTTVFLPIHITHFELRDTATLFDELDQETIPVLYCFVEKNAAKNYWIE